MLPGAPKQARCFVDEIVVQVHYVEGKAEACIRGRADQTATDMND